MPNYAVIKNGIFISNVYSVIGNYITKDEDILAKNNIKVVVSALTEEEYDDYMIAEEDFPDIEWNRFIIDDDETQDISQYFFEVHRIISEAVIKNKNIIVHCAAGISRSPTLVIAYLMIENKWTYEEAYKFVKSRCGTIDPNKGFVKQLKELEHRIRNS